MLHWKFKLTLSKFDPFSQSSYMHAIEVWGCALFARCFKLDYYLRQYSILIIRRNRDMKLWRRISSTNTALSDLLPPQRTRKMRTRSHHYILPVMSGQVVLNQFLLIDVSLIVTNIYLVVFLMCCFAFLYSFYCRVNCCKYVYAMNY